MSDETQDKSSSKNPVKFGSVEHEHLLRSGYKVTRKEATEIINQHKADASSIPYELYANAKAFMVALTKKPKVTASVAESMG